MLSRALRRAPQPTASTHAHLFQGIKDEATPAITSGEYRVRRQELRSRLDTNDGAELVFTDEVAPGALRMILLKFLKKSKARKGCGTF